MYVFEKGDLNEVHSSVQNIFNENEQPMETIYVNIPSLKEHIQPSKTIDDILSIKNTDEIDAAIPACFPINSIWRDRDLLFSQAKRACSHSKFLLSLRNQNSMSCRNSKDCTFHIKFIGTCLTKPEASKRKKYLFSYPVKITSTCFEHSEECQRNVSNFKAALQRSGIEMKVFDQKLISMLINLHKTKPSMPAHFLRPILETFSPSGVVWTSPKIRDFRRSFFGKIESLNEDQLEDIEVVKDLFASFTYSEIYSSANSNFGDFTSFNSKKLHEMFVKEYEGGLNHNFAGLTLSSGSPASTVEGYLHFCKSQDKSFDFRILKNQDGEIICCAWMTGFMRDAFERFGTYVSFDGCHKKMNTALYPYFGVLVKDSNNCILPVIEALGQGEQDVIIIFLFQSLLSMAKSRKASEILVVSSDGVMDQSFVTERLALPNAKFWADLWHLIQRNLGNKRNIPIHVFQQISSAVWVMARSSTKEKFDLRFTEIVAELHKLNVTSAQMSYFTTLIQNKKQNFAYYLMDSIPGLFGFHGTQANESKHSTFQAYFDEDYCCPPFRLICDLLHLGRICQQHVIQNLSRDKTELKLMQHKAQNSKSPTPAILQALAMVNDLSLNLAGFKLWLQEFNIATDHCKHYFDPDGTDKVSIFDPFFPSDPYEFTSLNSRCPGCKYSTTYQLQCRHEIANRIARGNQDNVFCIEMFDRRWHYQEDICILERKGADEDVPMFSLTQVIDGEKELLAEDDVEEIQTLSGASNTSNGTPMDLDTSKEPPLCLNLLQERRKSSATRKTITKVQFRDIDRITEQFKSKLESCGNENIKKRALGMLLSIIDSCDKEDGASITDVQDAWDVYSGNIQIPKTGTHLQNTKDPRKVAPAALACARKSNTLTTHEKITKRLKDNSHMMSSKNLVSKGLGNSCGFCNKTGCTIGTCGLKSSYGKIVENGLILMQKITTTYPIAKTALVERYKYDDPLFHKKNTHHVVVHSIHPRNDTPLPMDGRMLDMNALVVVISCLQRKMDRNTMRCGLPIEGLTKVAVPCLALFQYSQNILQTKGNRRFLFDNIEKDGNGSGFVNRTKAYMEAQNFSQGVGVTNENNT